MRAWLSSVSIMLTRHSRRFTGLPSPLGKRSRKKCHSLRLESSKAKKPLWKKSLSEMYLTRRPTRSSGKLVHRSSVESGPLPC